MKENKYPDESLRIKTKPPINWRSVQLTSNHERKSNMEYNKVKKEFDQHYLTNRNRRVVMVLWQGQLITPTELKDLVGIERIHRFSHMFDVVEISRKNTYEDSDGYRFERKVK